jgi:PAS domain S-box-containing protein
LEKDLEERNENLEERNEANTHTIKVQRKGLLAAEDTILGILDASFHALFVINEEGIIQMVNEKSSGVFGWSKQELVGSNINIIMPSDVASSHDQYLKNYLKTGVKKMIGTQREVTAQRKDGSTFPCVLGLSEVSKDSRLICGFIRDLSSEKQIQREVEEQHNLMTKIMDASFHALFVIDSKGIIQMVNERSVQVLGWTREQFIGHNISMIMPDEHAHQHDEYLKRYIATGFKRMIGKEREVLAKRKDGSTFPCVLGLSEIDNCDGVKLFVGFLEDITVRKSLLIAEAEREASDNLLHNILPEHIAKRLKQDPSHIADHYENTTILFADIVGFTDKTSLMSPHDVVTMLNNLFSKFDYLVGQYDLNKVKTIGDCYMVTSIPSSEIDNDGCSRVCMFALDLLKCVKAYNVSGPLHGHIDMRVGIACGQVVAGVVGTKRFLFDIWGDAVNVAARMEQHGLPGHIQVTKEVVDNVGNAFSFESRGTLNIKGKGMLECYFLKAANEKIRSPIRRSVYNNGPAMPTAARSNSTDMF